MKEPKSVQPRLGRGLSSLLSDLNVGSAVDAASGDDRRMVVGVDQLRPNTYQPRRHFEAEALEDLTNSIAAKGVLQPLIVRPDPAKAGGYEIVAGERRWRAAQAAGVHQVPVLVRALTDAEAAEIALIENVQRSDLNALDEAAAYRKLIDTFGHTQDALSDIIGKSRSHIANSMRLLRLPPDVQLLLTQSKLSAGHARALLAAPNPSALARDVLRKGLNVRQTERLVQGSARTSDTDKTPGPRKGGVRAATDPDTLALEGELSASLGMGVRILHEPGTETGILKITYHKLDDLDLLCRVLAVIPKDIDSF
jgi:ParB family chromosome partitioning protein